MAPLFDGEARELHAVTSAAQPSVSAGREKQSLSQKRRSRMRRVAVLKSQLASQELTSQLVCGSVKWDTPSPSQLQIQSPSLLELRLDVIERKLDELLWSIVPPGLSHRQSDDAFNMGTYIPNVDAVVVPESKDRGISWEVLSKQCSSARTLQAWWRRLVGDKLYNPCSELIAETQESDQTAASSNGERASTVPAEILQMDTLQEVCFQKLPSVGTWISMPPKWTETETGEFIMVSRSEFLQNKMSAEAYSKLEQDVNYCLSRCPLSNRPWVREFLAKAESVVSRPQPVKENLSVKLKEEDEGKKGDCLRGKDQEFEDELLGKWWYKGRLICYYCGNETCLASEDQYCERRRKEHPSSKGTRHSNKCKRQRPKK